MRCPKCGYISYDHLEECLKCKKNIKTTSDDLQGSVFNVAPPLFLKLQPDRPQETSSEDMDMFVDDEPLDDFVDEDLEVLIDDDDDEIEMESDIVFEDEDEDEDSMAAVEMEVEGDDAVSESFDEDDDSEFELDFGQLEDTSELETAEFDESEETAAVDEQPAKEAPTIEIPDELADLSDLAPPVAVDASDNEAPAKVTEEDIDSLDFDALDFEFGLGGLEGDLLGGAGEKKEAVLALDDIDFSEALADIDEEKPPAKPAAKSTDMGMDEELNFDLDLGGLSIHDDV